MNYILKQIQDYKMYLFDDDEGISKDLIRDGIREIEATEVVKSILNPNWIVLDIGANIGYYVLMEAKVVKLVYAIEPIKRNIDLLNENIKLNGYENVKTYRLAVGEANTNKNILVSKYSNLATLALDKMNKIHKDWFNEVSIGFENVDVITIDSFCDRENIIPDFIRMDIEGYEVEAIKGMNKTLGKMAIGSYLFIEFHPMFREDKNEMLGSIDNILSYGFKCVNYENLREIIEQAVIAPEAILKKC